MLVGFIGKIGSGKTTAADFLVENYKFTKHNFKDALDEELRDLYPEMLAHFHMSMGIPGATDILSHKPTPTVIRELKQKHGTDVRRGTDPDYWVKKWVHKYQNMFSDNVCVDDVRFYNEVDVVKRFGGLLIRLVRSDETAGGGHESETALDDYEADYTIIADPGDLNMVFMSLEQIIEDDIRDREKDSDSSGADAEYTEVFVKEGGG